MLLVFVSWSVMQLNQVKHPARLWMTEAFYLKKTDGSCIIFCELAENANFSLTYLIKGRVQICEGIHTPEEIRNYWKPFVLDQWSSSFTFKRVKILRIWHGLSCRNPRLTLSTLLHDFLICVLYSPFFFGCFPTFMKPSHHISTAIAKYSALLYLFDTRLISI